VKKKPVSSSLALQYRAVSRDYTSSSIVDQVMTSDWR
jgi:hypothetical protein